LSGAGFRAGAARASTRRAAAFILSRRELTPSSASPHFLPVSVEAGSQSSATGFDALPAS